MNKTIKLCAVLISMAMLTACASVGVRTVGNRPITIIVGNPQPSPTPVVVASPKEVK